MTDEVEEAGVRRRTDAWRRAAALLAALGLAVAAAGCTSDPEPTTPPEQKAAEQFLSAIGTRDAAGAADRTTDAAAGKATVAASLDGLGPSSTATYEVTKLSERTASSATAAYTGTWTFPGTTEKWTFDGTLPMVKQGDDWKVEWSASVVHPGLLAGQHLTVTRTPAPRADLLDSAGAPIFTSTDVVVVGIQPAKATDVPGLAQTLAGVFGISAADIVADVTAAAADSFVTVITVRKDLYESVRAQIYDLPGTVFRAEKRLLPPTTGWGQPLLGTVGPATKEIIDASSGATQAGDETGLSGLQRAYDKLLRGTPGVDVYAAADSDDATSQQLATVAPPAPGTDLRLTLDRAAQSAAQTVLAAVAQQAAFVAVQPSTGKILASANSASASGNLAMAGQFPPGSTFKMVTFGAAFSADKATTPQTPAACPGTVSVDGREFENQDAFDKSTVSLRDAFAYSCNTTTINLALGLGADALPAFAKALGVGATWDLPVDAYAGSVPPPAGQTELAADAIGQGKVLMSPLGMALLAGAAVTGTPIAPSLDAAEAGAQGTPIDPTVTTSLTTVMRAVVEQPFGTAHDLAGLPGEIQGKTGTAEFGTKVPPDSHAWFVGVRGDLAIAVFVYGGQSSSAAVPLAKAFLTAYA